MFTDERNLLHEILVGDFFHQKHSCRPFFLHTSKQREPESKLGGVLKRHPNRFAGYRLTKCLSVVPRCLISLCRTYLYPFYKCGFLFCITLLQIGARMPLQKRFCAPIIAAYSSGELPGLITWNRSVRFRQPLFQPRGLR